jgi:RHS repeat-associated protein
MGMTSDGPMLYDADDHRMTLGGSAFAYDGDDLVYENTQVGQSFFVWGPTGHILTINPNSNSFSMFQYDPSGNTVDRVSGAGGYGSGPIEPPNLYDGYGALVWTTYQGESPVAGDSNGCFLYKGQAGCYTDIAAELVYCQHRYYDPIAARWLTRDPIGLEGGINSYEYCDDNPVSSCDPSGNDWNGVTVNNALFYMAGTFKSADAAVKDAIRKYMRTGTDLDPPLERAGYIYRTLFGHYAYTHPDYPKPINMPGSSVPGPLPAFGRKVAYWHIHTHPNYLGDRPSDPNKWPGNHFSIGLYNQGQITGDMSLYDGYRGGGTSIAYLGAYSGAILKYIPTLWPPSINIGIPNMGAEIAIGRWDR